MKKRIVVYLMFIFLGTCLYFGNRYGKHLHHLWYFIFPVESYISHEVELSIDTDTLNTIDPNYGDWLVHPCVRYIEEGLGGHKWWLAVTPYPEGNNKYEQPILYYGDTNTETPPKSWSFYGFVQNMHAKKNGYNADPNLYYDSNSKQLVVVWKEAYTTNTMREAQYNALMYRTFDGKSFGNIKKLADNCSSDVEYITCPTLMNIRDSLCIFATEFEHKRNSAAKLQHGRSSIALWKVTSTSIDSLQFGYSNCLIQKYPQGFDYWHTDFAYDSYSTNYFSVVTDENGFTLLVGKSEDGLHYKYVDKPLKSFHDRQHDRNLYKASIVPMERSIYVFYPKRLKGERRVHIYYAGFDRTEFLKIFE